MVNHDSLTLFSYVIVCLPSSDPAELRITVREVPQERNEVELPTNI